MNRWLRRARGGLAMAVTWAMLWMPVGLLVGMLVDPDGSMDEPWLLVGALPGFLGGVAFALVLGIVARRRRFDELSVPRFAAWGAAAGLLVGAIWVALAAASDPPRWALYAVVIGFLTVQSAVSAAVSLAVARRAQRAAPRDADDRGDDPPGLLGAGPLPAATSRRCATADAARSAGDR